MSKKLEQASKILRDFWGVSGPDKVLQRSALRALKLKSAEAEELMDELPPPGTGGTTGERISECYRFLERLSLR